MPRLEEDSEALELWIASVVEVEEERAPIKRAASDLQEEADDHHALPPPPSVEPPTCGAKRSIVFLEDEDELCKIARPGTPEVIVID